MLFSVEGFKETKKQKGMPSVVRSALAADLPYEDICDDVMVYTDGSVGCCFAADPIYADSLSDQAKNQIVRTISSGLNTLSLGSYLQVLWRKVDYSAVLEEHKEQVQTGDPLVRAMTEDRVAFWRNMEKSGQVFGVECELWLRRAYARHGQRRFNPLLGSAGISAQKEIDLYFREHERIVKDFGDHAERFASSVREALPLRRLSGDEMYRSLCLHLQGMPPLTPRRTDLPIRLSFGGTDVAWNWGYLSLGNAKERQIAILSMLEPPPKTYLTMLNAVLSEPTTFTVVMNIGLADQDMAREFLRKTWRRHQSVLFFRDPEVEERVKEVFTLMSDLERTQNVLFKTEFHILLEGRDVVELGRRVSDMTSKCAASMEMGVTQEKAALHLVFRSTLPGSCYTGIADRDFLMKTENVADLMPVLGPIRSARRPVMLLRAPYQAAYGYDPFDRRLPAPHALVVGGTGSGKSFATNLLTLSFLSQNPLVFIVDKGGSYEKFVSLVGGSYIDVTKVSFNPLEGRQGWEAMIPHRRLILQEMIRDGSSGSGEEERYERIVLDTMLQTLYRRFDARNVDRDPTLSDAYMLLQEHRMYGEENEGELAAAQNRIMLLLSPWCKAARTGGVGNYATLVDNPITNVSLDNDVIAFDLHGIEQHKTLQKVLFLILAGLVIRKFTAFQTSRPKLIVLDEALSLIESEEGARFVGELYRTMRKYHCMVLSIVQDVQSLVNLPVGNAILNNINQTFILRQSDEARIANLREIFKLNPSEEAVISSLSRRNGYYSELFLRLSGVGSSKFAVVPSPVEYWMATTDPVDMRYLRGRYEAGVRENPAYRLEDAAMEMARRFPHGIGESGIV